MLSVGFLLEAILSLVGSEGKSPAEANVLLRECVCNLQIDGGLRFTVAVSCLYLRFLIFSSEQREQSRLRQRDREDQNTDNDGNGFPRRFGSLTRGHLI